MSIRYLTVGFYWLLLSYTWAVCLPVVVDALSKREVEEPVGRQEFEQFQDEVNQKLQKVLVGIVKDESLKGPAGTKGEKGETGLPGADANVGLVMALLERMDRMVQHMSPDTPCGGFITVDGVTDVVYRVTETGVPQSCVWIVAAKTAAPLKLRLVEFTRHTGFKLGVYNPYRNSNCHFEEITSTTSEITINSQFAIVFFYGLTPGAGFKLKIEDKGTSISSRKVSFLQKHDSFISPYPLPPLSEYGNDETFFLLGRAWPGKIINVSVTDINTESCCDYVTLMWADLTRLNVTSCESRSGMGVANIRAVVPENAPFVVYFHSDGSSVGNGFQVNATYS